MGNKQSIQGDTGFLHKQFCCGVRDKRQQVNFSNIQLKLLIFYFSGNSMEGDVESGKVQNTIHQRCGQHLGFVPRRQYGWN